MMCTFPPTPLKELEGCSSGAESTAAIRAALAHLTRLKGVGPATASAALSAMSCHVPFMSDEALEAVSVRSL